MKYRLILLAVQVSTAFTVSAQKAPVNFNGTIVDAFTRQAIKGEVTCSLLRPDSTVVMTTKSYEHTDRGNGTVRTFFKFDVPWQPDGHFLVKLEAKGYETKELINALDMSAIRNKRQDVLAPLEEALGIVMS